MFVYSYIISSIKISKLIYIFFFLIIYFNIQTLLLKRKIIILSTIRILLTFTLKNKRIYYIIQRK